MAINSPLTSPSNNFAYVPGATASSSRQEGNAELEQGQRASENTHGIATLPRLNQVIASQNRPPHFLQRPTSQHASASPYVNYLPFNFPPPIENRVAEWITALETKSGNLTERKKIGRGVFHKLPSSEQYQFIKRSLGPVERRQLTAALRYKISTADNTEETNRLGRMLLSTFYTRLRAHTPDQREEYQKKQLKAEVGKPAKILGYGISSFGIYGGLIHRPHIPLMLQEIEETRDNYYSSPDRPEYAAAMDEMMEMIGSGDEVVPLSIKRDIIKALLVQYSEDGLLTDTDKRTFRDMLSEGREYGEEITHAQCDEIIAFVTRAHPHISMLALSAQSRNLPWPPPPRVSPADRMRPLRPRREAGNEEKLSINFKNAYKTINEIRKAHSQDELAVPSDSRLEGYNDNIAFPDNDYFARLLERAAKDARNEQKNRKNEVYKNIETIFLAFQDDDDWARDIFSNCAGGIERCMNNAMEYVSELAEKSMEHLLIAGIESGKVDIPQFVHAMDASFRLSKTKEFIERGLIPELVGFNAHKNLNGYKANRKFHGRFPQIKDAYEAEISQRLKWNVKEALELPETVNPSTAEYPGYDKFHDQFCKNLIAFVKAETKDPKERQEHFKYNMTWEKGIIAFARQFNKKDVGTLESYTELAHKNIKTLHEAIQAIPVPREGQKVDGETIEEDKYTTEYPEHQKIADAIKNLWKSFYSIISNIQLQFAMHATPSMLSVKPSLPRDGQFSPRLAIPEDFISNLKAVLPQAVKASTTENAKRKEGLEKEVNILEKEIATLMKNEANRLGKNEKEMQGIRSALLNYYQAKIKGSLSPDQISPLTQYPVVASAAGEEEEKVELSPDLTAMNEKIIDQWQKNKIIQNLSTEQEYKIKKKIDLAERLIEEAALSFSRVEETAKEKNLLSKLRNGSFSWMTAMRSAKRL